MNAHHTVKVSVPKTGRDGPRLGHVGVVAAVCFAIGVIWPTLAGVRLVPTTPNKEVNEAPKAAPKPERRRKSRKSDREVPVARFVPQTANTSDSLQVAVDKSLVVNCRDKKDRRLGSCDKPGFDSVATDRLKALATCEAAEGAQGTLSIGFDLDFGKQKIRQILRGKSTTFGADVTEALIACARREFLSATLSGVEHTHARYLLFYLVTFTPPGMAVGVTAEAEVPVTGSATIVWNSARLRAEPEDGKVKARLLYGTKVFVTARKGEWYKVRYDARGNEAWVHKNALLL